jgi:hypothetical protein
MTLQVVTLAGFPAINTTFQRTAGTPTDTLAAQTGNATIGLTSYTNGVYTQSGTQYVAGILDSQGINPSRIFLADNTTGSGSTGATIPLPTLVSVTQVSAHGQSIQNLDAASFMYTDKVGYSGFVVLLNAATGQQDSGIYPLGFSNAVDTHTNTPGWTSQGGAYTNAAITVGYPQPQMRFFVSFIALLLIATTSTG